MTNRQELGSDPKWSELEKLYILNISAAFLLDDDPDTIPSPLPRIKLKKTAEIFEYLLGVWTWGEMLGHWWDKHSLGPQIVSISLFYPLPSHRL